MKQCVIFQAHISKLLETCSPMQASLPHMQPKSSTIVNCASVTAYMVRVVPSLIHFIDLLSMMHTLFTNACAVLPPFQGYPELLHYATTKGVTVLLLSHECSCLVLLVILLLDPCLCSHISHISAC